MTDHLTTARTNVAARYRARGRDDLAAKVEAGDPRDGWAVRHEVLRLEREAEKA